MSMRAKVLLQFAKPEEHLDVFELVGRAEKAVNAFVRETAMKHRIGDEPLRLIMRREKMDTAETMIRSSRCLYTRFSLGEGQHRQLCISVDYPDQDFMPEKGAVMLSLGMSGPYRKILSACAKALASGGVYYYGDDSFDGFITGEELQQMMANEAKECEGEVAV